MSFKTNQSQQLTLHDSFIQQTPRTQKIIRNSWCSDFADIVFPAINEERFSVLYSDNDASRPNTPVNFIIGALLLKENNDLGDDELVESICCDIRYQYALHTTHLKEQPVSDRTFSRFREFLYHYELETGENLLAQETIAVLTILIISPILFRRFKDYTYVCEEYNLTAVSHSFEIPIEKPDELLKILEEDIKYKNYILDNRNVLDDWKETEKNGVVIKADYHGEGKQLLYGGDETPKTIPVSIGTNTAVIEGITISF